MPTLKEPIAATCVTKEVSGDRNNASLNEHVGVPVQNSNRKYAFERAIGTILLIPALPLIGACWLLVRLSTPGPGFYYQTRVGANGVNFKVIKLRTMRLDAEADGPQWSGKGDPRVTRVGAVMRKLHLDELPQLVNVAKGEMVLVGPRPERPEFVSILSQHIIGYELRLRVKPGITGLAQVNLPPDSDLQSVRRKQLLDVYHIENGSFWMDQKLIFLTALRLFGVSNNTLLRISRLDMTHLLMDLHLAEGSDEQSSIQSLVKASTLIIGNERVQELSLPSFSKVTSSEETANNYPQKPR